MKRIFPILAGIISLLFLTACSTPNDPILSSKKEVTSFEFSSLSATGMIDGNVITVYLPYGTNVTSLIADFSYQGSNVYYDGTSVESGITALDYGVPLTLTVVAEDQSEYDYLVVVNYRFTDDFNRADSDTVGNNWIEIQRGDSVDAIMEISGNQLKLTGGIGAYGNAESGQATVAHHISGTGNFNLSVDYILHSNSRTIFYFFPELNNVADYYCFWFSASTIRIFRCIDYTTEVLVDDSVTFFDDSHSYNIKISIIDGILEMTLTDNSNQESLTITANDSTFQSFSTFNIGGGFHDGDAISDYVDNLTIKTVN